MDYDFSQLCADQIEKLVKRLESLKKSYLKEYMVALRVVNHANVNDNIETISVQVDDLFRDEIRKSNILWIECMNKVQRLLIENLKG